MQQIMKLHASGNADSLATLEAVVDGMITAIWGHLSQVNLVQGTGANFEVSFASSNGFITNDTRGSICGGRIITNLLTSGASAFSAPFAMVGCKIPVAMGERIHLHIASIGSPTDIAYVSCWLLMEAKAAGRRRAAARRVS